MKRWFGWFLPLLLLANSCIAPATLRMPVTSPIQTTAGVELDVLGHIGGAAMAVALRGRYAFVGFSFELAVLDLVDPTQPQWVTALPIPANDLVLAGRYAYAVGRDGLAVVDIADPTRPAPVSALALPDTASVIVLSADYAFVSSYGDLYVITIADPLHPAVVTVIPLAVRINGLATSDTGGVNELYVVTNAGMQQFDVSNPTQPRLVATIADQRFSFGPVIADGSVYFGGKATLWVKAVASPAAPRAIPLNTGVEWIGDVAVMNGIAYLVVGFQGLHVWDITDPTQPVAIGAYPLGGLTKAVIAQDGYVYTIDCDEGLRIFAAANPHELVTRSIFTPLGLSYNLAVNGDFAYVAAGYSGGLHQVALTNPAQVHTIATHLLRSEVSNLITVDHYLYLTNGGGVGVIDLATTPTPRVVAYYPLMSAWGIAAAEQTLYVSDPAGNLWLLDRTDPLRLAAIAAYPELGYANGMAVTGGMVYIAHKDVGMRLLALGPTGELTMVGIYRLSTTIHKIVVAGHYAYLAVGERGIDVVDVSELAAPRLVSRYDTPGEARDLAVQWPYLLVADGGLRVFDMTQPPRLTAVAHYATADCIHQVVSANGLIYVAQALAGLTILRLTPPPSAPKEAP